LKVAVVQDWLIVNGGAEKVTKGIIDCFDKVDVFSLIDFLSDSDRAELLDGKYATTSFIQKLPFAKNIYRYYLPYFPRAIEELDFSGYDLVISSSYAVAKGVITNADQVHICYCHTPMRYIWDLFHTYLKEFGLNSGLKARFVKKQLHKLRIWDIISSQRVDHFIANSNNVAKRISKIYRRSAEVIYPPVEINKFEIGDSKEDFYFTSSRHVPYKKNDLIIRAFNELPNKKLIVGGTGPELKKLRKIAKSNIEFTEHISQEKLIYYMQSAKAFIIAANEDFGITPLEAQACGTPVIALKKGGYLETVLENKTGVFFEDQSEKAIIKAINVFEKSGVSYTPENIRDHAMKFSYDQFKLKIKSFVSSKMK